jgi:hypothetical protein
MSERSGDARHPTDYELTFNDPGAEAETLIVHRTDRTGPGGHTIYADETGIVQAEISDRGEVRMIATGGHQSPPRVVTARHYP